MWGAAFIRGVPWASGGRGVSGGGREDLDQETATKKWWRPTALMGGASWRQAAWRLPVYALLIFAVLMLATEAAIYSDYRTERASRIALLEHDLRASVHINHQTMLASLHDVGADVCYLAEHAALYRLINGDPAALAHLHATACLSRLLICTV